jgi:hypothetical protein
MATGSPNWVMVTTRINVGKAIINKPTPSSPILRAITILLIKPRTLVIRPAIKRMKVPFKNFDIPLPTFSKKKNSYTINYMQEGGQSMTKRGVFLEERLFEILSSREVV